MYYCYDNIDDRRSQQWALEFGILFGICILYCLGQIILLPRIVQKIVYLFAASIAIFFFIFSLLSYFFLARKYIVTDTSITIRYPFYIQNEYQWADIREIGICKVHYTSKGFNYDTVLRCVVGEERNGPSKGYGFWANELYSAFHLRKVIIIRYSEYRQSELQSAYPGEIIDYRGIRRYYHDPE